MLTSGITAESAQNQFLELLVTQLRNQDPLEPVNQHDFLSQLAQFSTLESVENLNSNFEELLRAQALSQGSDLLGHVVTYQQEDASQPQAGQVEGVQLRDNQLVLNVDGSFVPIDLVESIIQ